MMILKNIWNHRRTNAWIFIELVLVAIISWSIIDPVAVGLSDLNMPTGYDNDHMLVVDVVSYPKTAPSYDSTAVTPERRYADICNLMMKLRNHPDISFVTINLNNSMIGGGTRTVVCPGTGNLAADTIRKRSFEFYYFKGTDFFQTYGIESVEGSPTVEELSDRYVPMWQEAVVTKAFADLYWPGENPMGKRLMEGINQATGDTVFSTVVGVVGDVRHVPVSRSYTQVFRTCDDAWLKEGGSTSFYLIARVREGKDIRELKDEITSWARKELKAGNYHIRRVRTYDELIERTAVLYGAIGQLRLSYVLAGFFLINLILGVIGTFWLQTRKRIPEMGIRRAFGAARGSLITMLVKENLLLATGGCLLGFLIYWQYAFHNGLANGDETNLEQNVVDNWIGSFGEHFLIVSLIVYGVIAVCVIVGTLIPAMAVSRVQIVDAIRSKE